MCNISYQLWGSSCQVNQWQQSERLCENADPALTGEWCWSALTQPLDTTGSPMSRARLAVSATSSSLFFHPLSSNHSLQLTFFFFGFHRRRSCSDVSTSRNLLVPPQRQQPHRGRVFLGARARARVRVRARPCLCACVLHSVADWVCVWQTIAGSVHLVLTKHRGWN